MKDGKGLTTDPSRIYEDEKSYKMCLLLNPMQSLATHSFTETLLRQDMNNDGHGERQRRRGRLSSVPKCILCLDISTASSGRGWGRSKMCNFPTFVAFIYFKLTLPREKCNKISPSPYPRAVAVVLVLHVKFCGWCWVVSVKFHPTFSRFSSLSRLYYYFDASSWVPAASAAGRGGARRGRPRYEIPY